MIGIRSPPVSGSRCETQTREKAAPRLWPGLRGGRRRWGDWRRCSVRGQQGLHLGHREQDTPAEMLRDTGLGGVEGAWEPKERLTDPRQSRPFKPGDTAGGAGVEPKVRRS